MLVPPANFGIAEEGIYRCSKVETLNLSFLETLDLKTVIYIGGQEPSKFFREFFNRSSIEWLSIRIADYANVVSQVNTLQNSEVSPTIDQITEEEVAHRLDPNSNENQDLIRTVDDRSTTGRTTSDNEICTSETEEGPADEQKMETLDNHRRVKQLKYTLNDNDELMLIKSYCLKKTFKLLLNKNNNNILLVDKSALIIGILRKIQKWNISSIINEYRLYAGKNRSYFAETFLELIDLRIEQEKTEKFSQSDKELLSIPTQEADTDSGRKLSNSNLTYVTEFDLCKPPQVPRRLLSIVEETQRRENHTSEEEFENSDADSLYSQSYKRSTSDMGIFGHRYRLTFDKKESGDFDFYKASNAESDNTDCIRIQVPMEGMLPEWFKFQRDTWEQDNAPEVHHFYKEEIYI
ncbi:Oca4 protein [Maudiozyma humilis]|uniref:Oca4 protein n=1 Tax=Maudiozyma humilis TaxID=51915 RepID=A0AAV5RTQ5_MAUHU|nr:Oca4 protein [Kazachstania humilis]